MALAKRNAALGTRLASATASTYSDNDDDDSQGIYNELCTSKVSSCK